MPDDILSSLPSIPSSIIDEQSVPVLFVTPHFAPWVDPAGPFLERWMNRLYGESHLSGPLNAIAAIVDKLPGARPIPGDSAGTSPSSDAAESEGLSLLLVRSENVQVKPSPPRSIRGSEERESAFVFSVQTGTPSTVGHAAHRPTHEVGLRLTDTLFVNGNKNTLFGMRWARDSALTGLVLGQSVNLSTCNITSTAKTVRNSFELPLHPVTQRRKVVVSMGNILSVVTGATDDDTMPASAELEKELPRYIAENDFAEPLVSVWALVEKPEVGPPTETDTPQDRVARSLRGGGKLYRILSGGGGWGKKQGLLSLDPDISLSEASIQEGLVLLESVFDRNAPMQDSPRSLDKGIVIDDLNLLSQAASKGDYIQFFASGGSNPDRNICSELPSQPATDLSYRFGVASDAEDDGGTPADGMQQKDLTVLLNYFGALSSKTITYLQPTVRANSNGEILESRTKLDVPGSRVEMLLG